LTRNPKIAAVFHDLKFAETKGTGITTMKRLMDEAGLSTPPLIETDRDRNKFNLLLLPHHLLDESNLRWLSQFHSLKLTEADMRALVLAREVGAITNQDYRQINGTHTLAASNALRRLRDLGLLMMKGSGSETYYQPVPQLIGQGGATPYLSTPSEESSPYTNPLHKGLDAIPKGFPDLSDDLKNKIIHLKRRSLKSEVEEIITRLCALGSLQPVQIGKILDRDAQYLRINFLSGMVKAGKLAYQYPDKPAHPQQAYRVSEGE
jgi:ATP-dependent DNA helicase RecG